MADDQGAARTLTDEQVVEALALMKGADSVELKLTVPADCPAHGGEGARHRPAGRADPAGLLLRHARPRAQRERRRRARAPRPGQGRRHRRQAAAGRPAGAARGAPPLAELRRRGGRDAGRLRLLRLVQGSALRAARARDPGRRATDPQALLQGAARLLRGACARGPRPRRPVRAGADLRPQGQVRAERARAEGRRGGVALPRRLAPARALDQVRARRGVPGGRRDARVPGRARVSTCPGEQETKTRKALEFFAGKLAAAGA